MCLNRVVKTNKVPSKEMRIGYKYQENGTYTLPSSTKGFSWQSSKTSKKTEQDNMGVDYEPGFHILTNKAQVMKLAKYERCGEVYEVMYTDIVHEGYEKVRNIFGYNNTNSEELKCDIARKMVVLRKLTAFAEEEDSNDTGW